MCGFVGVLNLTGLPGTAQDRRGVLARMTRRLAHRGPDDEQLYDDGVLALGFRRLSIVDVEGGQQPLWNEDRTVLGVANGEIYNHADLRADLRRRHHFQTESDSEVLVHLYEERGEDLLSEVNGIFAAALWDRHKRRLLLTRDRLGVKPLYYAFIGETLLFGSELKALLAHPECPRQLNWQEVPPEPWLGRPVTPTFVRDVHHLPAGHLLICEAGSPARARRYWCVEQFFPEPDTPSQLEATDFAERYGDLFRDSVRRQLMSDVPLGIFLSGGIDSALITAAAAAEQRGLHCFTVAEQTTQHSGDLEKARSVAREFGNPLHELAFDPASMFDRQSFDLPAFERLIWTMDSPRFNLEVYFKYRLHQFAKQVFPEIKVILLGQGADEFAGGYSTPLGDESLGWNDYVAGRLETKLNWFQGLPCQRPWPVSDLEPRALPQPLAPFQRAMSMNATSLQFYNLWHEDRTSSAHGIEARVPFLDHRLVELLASIPPGLHEELFWDKQIVRRLIPQLLPAYPQDWPKIPFIDVPGSRSIDALYRGVLDRIFPSFREQYLEFAAGPLGQQAEALYLQACSERTDAFMMVRQLLYIMSVAVFERQCQQGASDTPPVSLSD